MKRSLLLIAALLVLCIAPFIGTTSLPLSVLWSDAGEMQQRIFFSLRLPRTILAFIAGGALAVSGLVFQAMFRNVLATPFTLGVSSGAALGATLASWLGIGGSYFGLSGSGIFSLLGAAGTILLVFVLAAPAQGFPPNTMLLAGVTVSFLFSSLILAIQYLSDFTQVFQVTRWLMGSLDVVGFDPILAVLPLVAFGLVLVFLFSRELDLITLVDELAVSRGLNAGRVRLILFAATSLMVGGVVAVCGPIGFVGLLVPYLCRLLTGTSHRPLIGVTFLTGAAFLTVCDTVGRSVISPSEIPVGVITALVGGPFFLYVLRRHRENPRL